MKPSVLGEDQLEFVVELCQGEVNLVRVCFASRHCINKNYTATVQIDGTGISDELTKAWLCTCATRPMVIGCCAHMKALIWHLGVCLASIYYDEHELTTNRFLLLIQDCLRYPDTKHSVNATYGSGDNASGYD
jgi:hypothetical protein